MENKPSACVIDSNVLIKTVAIVIAHDHNIGVYDGIFVALANQLDLPLLTDDQRLMTQTEINNLISVCAASDCFTP